MEFGLLESRELYERAEGSLLWVKSVLMINNNSNH